jgi:hypothetical protein
MWSWRIPLKKTFSEPDSRMWRNVLDADDKTTP